MLESSEAPLCAAFDLGILDLDGVVYVGREAVPGAPEQLDRARGGGMRLAFITNNAARPPEDVAEHLRELGVDARAEDVVTSAQAAARILVDRLGTQARVALLGGPGLDQALRTEDLVPVGVEDEADALVSGYGPDVRWRDIMRAGVRIRDGLWWVASNTDMTIPTAFGSAPGHGVLVDTLRRFTGHDPEIAGKPQRALFAETVRRVGGRRPLMVGDRLDTDIEGARNAEMDSLLVLTGVTGLEELVAAAPGERPTYLSPDLGGLMSAHPVPEQSDEGSTLGGWRAVVEDGVLAVEGEGSADDWWRVVADAAWRFRDRVGDVADVGRLAPPQSDSAHRSE
jgi:glycerol 3-phosphatase-2